MLTLSQKQTLQQKLSPQQIQYQKLLQLNTLALEQRIKNELELNPILEENITDEMELTQETEKEKEEETAEEEFDSYTQEEFDREDFMNDPDFEGDKLNRSNEEVYQPVAPARESLSEHLIEQLQMQNLREDLYVLGEEIIGSLDNDGYLKRNLADIINEMKTFEHIDITMEEGEELLKKIQTFDPPGIASRNLQECLLVQLRNSKFDAYYKFLAEELLQKYFDDFTKRRFEMIKTKMNLSDETLRQVFEIIHKLNPKPGEGNIESVEMNQITPDFIVEKLDDNFVITLNDRTLPSVTINKSYLEMFDSTKKKRKSPKDKSTYKFLREKFESAKWFIACIQQRRETLMKIMQAIVIKQHEFFDKGAKYLRPMIYKDIAEEIGMDISTISRVVNGKYVQSPQGIHELKYFFSEGLSTDFGEEVSNKHIKVRLQEIIEKENKKTPYSDDKLAEILNDEGIHIARRTVAKYREHLKIPIARLRREFK